MRSLTISHIPFDIQKLDVDIWCLIPQGNINGNALPKLAEAIYARKDLGIVDLISSQSEIMLYGNQIDFNALTDLQLHESKEKTPLSLPLYIQAGDDLDFLLDTNQLTSLEFQTQLTQATLKISHFGFVPGFIYMEGLPELLHIPRKKVPILSCPPRSIAIGGPYLGVYNFPTPAGWYLVGQTPLTFDLSELKNLNIGQAIKIELIDQSAYQDILNQNLNLQSYNA